jgi:O-antigen/teichoic acid export membrane protein
MRDLKERAIKGALVRVCAQAGNFLLRIGSLAVLARLLQPKDFGLVGMVTAFTGVLNLFRDFGLSAASVQRVTVTEEQTSTLFWINILVGGVLAVVTLAAAPVISALYYEPRLFWVTSVVSIGFLFNAAGIQHSALLQRQMRFTTLSAIDIGSWTAGTAIAIGAAMAGYGYWALVVMTVTLPLTTTVALWLTTGWVPGRPRRHVGIRSMLRFGGTMTLNGLIVYIASNFEKVLLGRYWGAESIGMYGRAYQLSRISTDTLNSAVGEVAFSALSRLQDDPGRLKSYFLKGYSLVLALSLPATCACALFADDLILVLLGPKWKDAVPIFRLLAPTILVFAIANPLSWLLSSIGLVGRGTKMSLVIAPIMIAGYLIGLPYGPRGVALAYSVVMMLWIIPVIMWSVHGTVICFRDVLSAVSRPLASTVVATGFALAVRSFYGRSSSFRLVLECMTLGGVYLGMLLYVMDQRLFYVDLLRSLAGRSSSRERALVSA